MSFLKATFRMSLKVFSVTIPNKYILKKLATDCMENRESNKINNALMLFVSNKEN